jgi:nitrate reductase, alpha subunit
MFATTLQDFAQNFNTLESEFMSNQIEQQSDYAIAAVVYADEGDAAITALWQAVRRLQQDGWRVAGLLNPIDNEGKHSNSELASVADNRRFSIFQNLGNHSSGCKLDAGALAAAGSVIREAIAEGTDLVVINKFGHAEIDNRGLLSEYLAAISSGIPVLTTLQSKTDWEIYKGFAKKFSELAKNYIGVRKDVVLTPLMHDSPQELGQPFDPKDWKHGECDPIPGKTMPAITVVERDYGAIYEKFTSVGPLLEKVNNNGKGMAWDTKHEVEFLRKLNGVQASGAGKGQPKIETAIDACEMILTLAPETNGHVAKKAWEALGKATGRDHTHLINSSEHTAIRFRDIVAQPRKIVTSPIWSGVESEEVCYNAGYTNVHELIPWRTITGRQQFYQDHKWMRDFGEHLCVYKPAVDFKTTQKLLGKYPNGNKEITLNFLTPHQKWGIHSTYSENLRMLTLFRGGPNVWISEVDAKKAGIVDNDWVEVFNANGTIACRAVVSQRIPETMILMYHAQEKIVHTPAGEVSQKRGGIHNSVTRAILKPTHMIGGYAQLAYGFNYYGTVGSNRDEWVIVRKMSKVDWMDEPAG